MPLVRRRTASLAALLALVLSSGSALAGTYKVLHTFQGGPNDGAHPMGTLIEDAQGNLYGTTYDGGIYDVGGGDYGTVFELSPPAAGKTEWTETVLWSFGASGSNDGAAPAAGLYMDGNGALYGTTAGGGGSVASSPGDLTYSDGTVFKLTPPANGQTAWTETVLFRFIPVKGDVHTGQEPLGPVTMDAAGALYGTTYYGGVHNYGTVFKLTPPSSGAGMWTQTLLYQFPNAGTARPASGLVLDGSGNVYGVVPSGSGGYAYRLAPPATGKLYWTYSTLGTFDSGVPDGLIRDGAGNFYITAVSGIYALSPPVSGSAWSESTLYTIGTNSHDGSYAAGAPALDAKGNVYFVSPQGGYYGWGGVYKLSRPSSESAPWIETRLGSGTDGAYGAYPYGGVFVDSKGNVFGTMAYGGDAYPRNKLGVREGSGTVFQITP